MSCEMQVAAVTKPLVATADMVEAGNLVMLTKTGGVAKRLPQEILDQKGARARSAHRAQGAKACNRDRNAKSCEKEVCFQNTRNKANPSAQQIQGIRE